MRILLLHPEDHPSRGPWAGQRWDRVIDLGFAGAETYSRWSDLFGCAVESIAFAQVDLTDAREALAAGRGQVVDSEGVDWWEIISVRYTMPLLQAIAVENIAKTLKSDDELFVSRPDFHAQVLHALLRREVRSQTTSTFRSQALTAFRRLRRLSCAQVKQILWDKYDSEYRIRRHISGKRSGGGRPFVLLPSAYVNVSRTALAYAASLPEKDFLLANARQNGFCRRTPENVFQVDLSSYVDGTYPSGEHSSLISRWKDAQHQLRNNYLLRLLSDVGTLGGFARELRQWLKVRDAWRNVYEREHITAVLSCDSSNPYTHIPLQLGKARGLPSIAAHHGALDGQNLLKSTKADVILAKGNMERDYLTRCRPPHSLVEVAAPSRMFPERKDTGDAIVFFSEDYEVSGARVEEYYREVLPRLIEVAKKLNKRVILKLHPAENMKDRRRMLKHVLGREQVDAIDILAGELTEDFMQSIRFAVTVISTTAMECALRRIPVFMCAWLENWPYKYAEHFHRFRVATPLRGPDQILAIPMLLRNYSFCDQRDLWEEAPQRLRELLRGSAKRELALAQ